MTDSVPTETATGATRVLIVDDHPAAREGLALRISRQPDLFVCGEAPDIPEALRLVTEARPDVAIIDIALKDGSGLDLVKRVKDRDDKVRMLVWSMYSEALYADRAIRAGAQGYVHKEEATDKIVEAIRRVLAGQIYVSPSLADKLLTRAVGKGNGQATNPVDLLSDRELEVFRLIGQGLDTQQVARTLCVSPKTVETYRSRIKDKLHLTGAAELMRHAVQWSLENGGG